MISQNGKSTLERLSACDRYLWLGEQMVLLRFVVCVVLPLLLSALRLLLYKSVFYCNVLILYCAAASLAWKIIETYVARNRKRAAVYYQVADCELFGIRWNKYLCGVEPLPEDVFFNINKRLSLDSYKNRYPSQIEHLPSNEAFLLSVSEMCKEQRVTHRKHLKMCKWIVAVGIVLIVVSSFLIFDMNMKGLLFYAILPCAPLVVWFSAIADNCKKSENQLTMIEAVVKSSLEDEPSGKLNDMIQDYVYLYREGMYLIPRFLKKRNS